MKKIFALLVLGISFSTQAQKLDKIQSVAKEWNELSYYENQFNLWQKEIEKNEKNEEAWINSYVAARCASIVSSPNYGGSDSLKYNFYIEQRKTILEKAKQKIEKTYAYNLIASDELGVFNNEKEVLAAEELNYNDDPRIFDALMIHYETKGNQAKKEYYAKKMYEANELPAGLINWAYNLLSELEPNAIVFTLGDMDTYALWITQVVKNHRTDVTIINYSMCMLDDYRNNLFKGKVSFDPSIKVLDAEEKQPELLDKAVNSILDSKNPVYISTSAYLQFEHNYSENLYLTGLAYRYSITPVDNQKIIVKNYESVYLLDHLKESFAYHEFSNKETDFNCMYLPSLLKLYTYYKTNGNLAKMDEIQPLLEDLGSKCQQDEQVNKCLNIEEMKLISSANFNAKRMEKSYLRVKNNVFMQEAEVTNYEYGQYLSYLKENKMDNALKVALYDSTQWEKKFKYSIHDPLTDLYAWHPAYQNYPIVNISYEGATAYCNWLTQQYNQQKKRSYKKVVFRLPTKAEWLEMATAGKPTELNPFPGGTIKNQSGCYLANIKPTPTSFFEDGGFHSVNVSSYNPNNLGFYNSFGNVSEMINVKGAAMGGSWYNLYEECTFDKTQNYTGADPGVGFRVVMEIIEQ
jgi:formylglycine-generating enzyme required for sulfatase activity